MVTDCNAHILLSGEGLVGTHFHFAGVGLVEIPELGHLGRDEFPLVGLPAAELSAGLRKGLQIAVADHGPGLAEGDGAVGFRAVEDGAAPGGGFALPRIQKGDSGHIDLHGLPLPDGEAEILERHFHFRHPAVGFFRNAEIEIGLFAFIPAGAGRGPGDSIRV